MKIAVLGTGTVGATIAEALVDKGQEVWMGSRTADNERAVAFAEKKGELAHAATFANAVTQSEIVFNCTQGQHSLAALESAGKTNLTDKILIDLANPLDFSRGMPPVLSVGIDDSLGEQIQRAFPDTHVVKALNTLNSDLMVDPRSLDGAHDLLLCGNNPDAKKRVRDCLADWFGWESFVDLGDIKAARTTEAYVLLWLRLYSATGTAKFNIRVVR